MQEIPQIEKVSGTRVHARRSTGRERTTARQQLVIVDSAPRFSHSVTRLELFAVCRHLVWCFVDDEKRKPAVRKTAKCHVDSRLFVLAPLAIAK